MRSLYSFVFLLAFGSVSLAFANDRDEVAPLEELEQELKVIAHEILNNDSLEYKLELNVTFQKRLYKILQREDSYHYEFKGLETVSRIRPEDNSFRVFTWYILDKSLMACRYYGMVQRKIIQKNGASKVVVVPLVDNTDYQTAVESNILTPTTWMGALYYFPKGKTYGVTTYEIITYKYHPIKKKEIKQKNSLYVLLGWNGHDISTDYKIIDTIQFEDKEDTTLVTFGMPIFYFSPVPKARVVFEYGDNSPFSLNYAEVIRKNWLGIKRKREMIVFDHLTMPKNTRPTQMWQAGAEGTYDALNFYNKFYEARKGFFGFLRDVQVWTPELNKYNPKVIQKQAKQEQKRLEKAGIQLKNNPKK